MKRTFVFILTVLALLLMFPVVSCANADVSSSIPQTRIMPLVVDDDDLLTDDEEISLLSRLEQLTEDYCVEVAVVTIYDLEGKTPEEYADDFYDYNGYGYGENYDGVLLLVSMQERDWHITGYGKGDYIVNNISDSFVYYLSVGDYYGAFSEFANSCEYLLEHIDSLPDDYVSDPDYPISPDYHPDAVQTSDIIIFALISLAVGLLSAFIAVSIMKSGHKTVRFNSDASGYAVNNRVNLTSSSDIFLYRTVSRTEIPRNNGGGSSSGGGFHTSSSGRTHSGTGGKF